jgi:ethanolamine utilization protein EutA
MLDGDVAQTLGAILHEEVKITNELLVIDGVTLWDFDYIDLGRIRLPSNTVPVTIKSLVFSQDPRHPHLQSHPEHHHHDDRHHHHHRHHASTGSVGRHRHE